jgi:ATP-dependent exoDNAse (exonuclease V) alpha subunit
MIVSTGKGNEIAFNAREYAYLDHGYAVTDYKALGQTTNITLYVADTRDRTNYNSFYVAATRGREDMYVFTNDKTELYEQVMIEQVKTSTLDFDKQLNLDKQELFKDRPKIEPEDEKLGLPKYILVYERGDEESNRMTN